MLVLKNFISRKMEWWIELETEDEIYTLHWAGKPFVGSQLMVDDYTEKLALQAIAQGLPLKSINVYPIKRAS